MLALLPGAAAAADLAHFAAQQGAAAGAHSAFLANVAATHVTLPAGFAAQCCLACHKPKTATSYVFPHGEFAAAAARRLGPPAPARPVSASASSVDAAP